MELQEIESKKAELSNKIKSLLLTFQDETKAGVDSVDVSVNQMFLADSKKPVETFINTSIRIIL